MYKYLVNNGINYEAQLVCRIPSINSICLLMAEIMDEAKVFHPMWISLFMSSLTKPFFRWHTSPRIPEPWTAVKIPAQQMPKNSSTAQIFWIQGGPRAPNSQKGYNPYKWQKINNCAWCYFTWNMSFHKTGFCAHLVFKLAIGCPHLRIPKRFLWRHQWARRPLNGEMWWPEDVHTTSPPQVQVAENSRYFRRNPVCEMNFIWPLHYFQRGSHASAVNAK